MEVNSISENNLNCFQEGFIRIKEGMKQLLQRILTAVSPIFERIGNAIEYLLGKPIFNHKVSSVQPTVVSTDENESPPICKTEERPDVQSTVVPNQKVEAGARLPKNRFEGLPEWFGVKCHDKHIEAISAIDDSQCQSKLTTLGCLHKRSNILSLQNQVKFLREEFQHLSNEKRDGILQAPYDANKNVDENRASIEAYYQKFLSEIAAFETKAQGMIDHCQRVTAYRKQHPHVTAEKAFEMSDEELKPTEL